MNPLEQTQQRAKRQRLGRIINAKGYDDLAIEFKEHKLRDKEDYDRCVAICVECSGEGKVCPLCKCPYKIKLMSPSWKCMEGKHGN